MVISFVINLVTVYFDNFNEAIILVDFIHLGKFCNLIYFGRSFFENEFKVCLKITFIGL